MSQEEEKEIKMNRDYVFILVTIIWVVCLFFLPNYSLYDYLKEIRLKSYYEKQKQNEGVLVVCKKCNGTGETEQDVSLLWAEALFAMWFNNHMTPNKCEVCSKDKLCDVAQKEYDVIMAKYKEIGPKIEMANCPGCMGSGSYKQYKGYRVGREKP